MREWRRRARRVLLVTAVGFVPAQPVRAQEMRMAQAEGSALVLPGGRIAIVVADSAGVVVRGVLAGDDPASGPAPDLREGDRVATLQGAGVATAEALAEAYDGVPEGDEIVLGLRRAGAEVELRFPRPAHERTGRTMVVSAGGNRLGAWSAAGPGQGVTEVVIGAARVRDNPQGMPEVIFLGSDAPAEEVPLRVGDVIVAVNGRTISALAGLELFYVPIAPGGEVALTVQREGAEVTVRFHKPAGR